MCEINLYCKTTTNKKIQKIHKSFRDDGKYRNFANTEQNYMRNIVGLAERTDNATGVYLSKNTITANRASKLHIEIQQLQIYKTLAIFYHIYT